MQPVASSPNTLSNVILQMLLVVLAFIAAFFGTTITLMLLWNAKQKSALTDAISIAPYMACLLGSWITAAILMALAKLLGWHSRQSRQQHDQIVALNNLNNTLQLLGSPSNNPAQYPIAGAASTMSAIPIALPPVPQPPPPVQIPSSTPAPVPAGSSDELIALLSQIRDLTMMTDEQRQQAAQRHWDEMHRHFEIVIENHLAAGEWALAQKQIDALCKSLPDDPLAQRMTDELTNRRATRAQQDVDAARPQIQHLMSLTAWPQAQAMMQTLQQRYPGEPLVEKLAYEVRHEREAFEKDNFSRLLTELRDATDRREWRRAYVAAQELIQRYPHDRKVEKLRSEQLTTIRENAEAQERKEEEALFKDLLQRQRYDDAAVVARRVIEKYPASSTAVELNKLLPKVEELIRQEKLKRQTAETKE